MNCPVYKTDPGECLGSSHPLPLGEGRVRANEALDPGCLNPTNPGEPWKPSAFTAHILRLDRVKKAGAHFGLGDLTASEWQGLEALNDWQQQKSVRSDRSD